MVDRVAELRNLRAILKSGDYDGTHIMAAWIAIEEYANRLEDPEFELGSKVRHYLEDWTGDVVAIDTQYEIQRDDGSHRFAWHRELERHEPAT